MTAAKKQEMLISELIELYSKDFEKLIQKIFNNDWILDVFTDEFFTIRNNNCYPIKVDFDENGAYKFTSGEGSMTVDMEKGFEEMGIPEEGIEELKNMSDKEKNAMLEAMGDEIPEGYDV